MAIKRGFHRKIQFTPDKKCKENPYSQANECPLHMAGRNAQSMACSCSPGPLWVKAEGIKEVFNSHRSNERTFVQSNPITFPGVNAPEGSFHSPSGPKHVARKVTAIHCISKDISELVSLLIWLPRDGEGVPTLVSTPIYLNVREKSPDSVSQPPASLCKSTTIRCSLRTLGHCPLCNEGLSKGQWRIDSVHSRTGIEDFARPISGQGERQHATPREKKKIYLSSPLRP